MNGYLRFIIFVFVLFVLGCGARVKQVLPEKPDWLAAKPYPLGYYTGIGHSIKNGANNYIQEAKKSALEDLVSEIKVTISSTSVLSQIDVNNQFREKFEQIIQTEVADEIEEFESVDVWEDQFNYWVYYRLSKARYKEIKEEKKRNAVLLGTDFYLKGRDAYRGGERIQALNYFFMALRSVEKYLAEAILITVEGKELFLTNEIYASIQDLLTSIDLATTPVQWVFNRRIVQNDQVFVISATYKDTQQPVRNLPLRAFFEKGKGEVYAHYKTDENGIAKILITKISSKELDQTIRVKVDVPTLMEVAGTEILNLLMDRLPVASVLLEMHVERPIVFMSSSEKTFGFGNNHPSIGNLVKNWLAKEGFEFTQNKELADLWININTDCERGNKTGSIFVTYLSGEIKVLEAHNGKEIYSKPLDRIKGYGLDFEKSGVDSYKKAMERIEKEYMNELMATILN